MQLAMMYNSQHSLTLTKVFHICIQDNVKGAAFEYCDVLGQLLNLDIQMVKTKILHVPPGITKSKEDLGC